MSNVKQVLIWRTDLRNQHGNKVRTGKIAAQLAHASMLAILNEGYKEPDDPDAHESQVFQIPMNDDMKEWLGDRFTKICVGVDSLEHLTFIYDEAKKINIPCSIICDAGVTEFNHMPTFTAVAIGPAQSDIIDKITGDLKLL